MPAAKTKAAKASPASVTDLSTELLNGVLEECGDEAGAQLLGSDGLSLKIRGVISTQNVEIDAAIGRGGVPLGRLTIIHGSEGSGKTTLALHLVAEVQAMGGIAVYMDKEYKLDPEYASSLGVDTSKLIISQPDYLEQIFKLMDSVVKRAAAIREKHNRRVPILVVLDSMNSCITKEMFEAEYGKREMAGVARVMSGNLPKLMPLVFKEDVALVFISQVRLKMNVMFGDDEEMAGGKAPKHCASLILHVKRLGAEREGEIKVGNKVRVEAKKNQIAPPFRRAEASIRYGKGFDKEAALLSRGVALELISKEGNTYAWKGEKLGIGEGNAIKAIRKSETFRSEIVAAISAKEAWNRVE